MNGAFPGIFHLLPSTLKVGWMLLLRKRNREGVFEYLFWKPSWFNTQALDLKPAHFRSFLVKLSTEKSSEVFGNLGNVRVRFATFGERSESSSRLLKGS